MAKKKGAEAPEPSVNEDWRRRVNFDFGQDSLKEPAGLRDLTINETVTVLVTGKVKTLRLDEEGSGLTLVMDKIELAEGKPKDDLSEAFAKTRRKL